MESTAPIDASGPLEGVAISADIAALIRSKDEQIAALQHQLEWFRRQIFGQKSERFAPEPPPQQMYLGEVAAPPEAPAVPQRTIAAHTRRAALKDGADTGEALPFFDE